MKDHHAQCAKMNRAFGIAVLGLWLGHAGCASDPPKPAPTVTPDHVRSHADQNFEKLQQEERARKGDSTVPR